ncbi:dihydroneopterin aldolase [candidate division KSB1 bacterium]|nr:dihydroneopterin aldolase [candidate division KSB1 bacterium]
MPRDKLKLMGMIFHAYHGCGQAEREHGQRFEVDVEMVFDSTVPAESDRIKETIDVRKVYDLVRDIVLNKSFNLIEAVCQRIADCVLESFDVEEVTVRVRKPFAPLGGLANGTEIEIIRQRS